MNGKVVSFLIFLLVSLVSLDLVYAQTSSVKEEVPTEETEGDPFDLSRSSAIQKLLDTISSNRLYKMTVSQEDIEKAVLQGIVSSLDDPYASILHIDNREDGSSSAKTETSDMGLILGEDEFDRTVVVSVLPGSPSEEAGIVPGDKVLRICGENVSRSNSWQALSLLRGDGLKVVVENPEKGLRTLTLHQHAYTITTVELRIGSLCSSFLRPNRLFWKDDPEGAIAWIKVHSFLGDRTKEEWSEMIAAVRASDSVGRIVLDLRDNGGGDNSCISLLGDFFLPGETLVRFESLMGMRSWTQHIRNSVTRRSRLISYPIVVLVNNRTASLSEIAAAALRDNRRVPLVGQTTFGKGTTQTWIRTDDHFAAHLTTGRWLSPCGYSVEGKGLVPDVTVVDSKEKPDRDEQLIEAVLLLESR